jgi:hypothetical protein
MLDLLSQGGQLICGTLKDFKLTSCVVESSSSLIIANPAQHCHTFAAAADLKCVLPQSPLMAVSLNILFYP